MELIRGRVRVTLEWVGEGFDGDYDATDPNDQKLLRFEVDYQPTHRAEREQLERHWVIEHGYSSWTPARDASYCTQLPASLTEAEQRRVLEYLMDEVYEPLMGGHGIKKLCERLSWIGPQEGGDDA